MNCIAHNTEGGSVKNIMKTNSRWARTVQVINKRAKVPTRKRQRTAKALFEIIIGYRQTLKLYDPTDQ